MSADEKTTALSLDSVKSLVTSSVDVIAASKRELNPTPKAVIAAQYLGAFVKYLITVASVTIQLFSVAQLTTCSFAGIANAELQNLCSVSLPSTQFYVLIFLSGAVIYSCLFAASSVIVSRNLFPSSARTIALTISVLGSLMVIAQCVAATTSMTQSLRFACTSPLLSSGAVNGQSLFKGECTTYNPTYTNSTTSFVVACHDVCTVRPGSEILLLCASILLTHIFTVLDLITYYNRAQTMLNSRSTGVSDPSNVSSTIYSGASAMDVEMGDVLVKRRTHTSTTGELAEPLL